MANKPHKIEQVGNGIFVHVPATFEDEETENWVNRTFPLRDGVSKWRMAPIDAENPFNKVVCIGDPGGSVHCALTVNKEPFNDMVSNADYDNNSPEVN